MIGVRAALFQKIHHTITDGEGGVRLAERRRLCRTTGGRAEERECRPVTITRHDLGELGVADAEVAARVVGVDQVCPRLRETAIIGRPVPSA